MGGDSGDSAPFMDTTDDDDNGYGDEDDQDDGVVNDDEDNELSDVDADASGQWEPLLSLALHELFSCSSNSIPTYGTD